MGNWRFSCCHPMHGGVCEEVSPVPCDEEWEEKLCGELAGHLGFASGAVRGGASLGAGRSRLLSYCFLEHFPWRLQGLWQYFRGDHVLKPLKRKGLGSAKMH